MKTKTIIFSFLISATTLNAVAQDQKVYNIKGTIYSSEDRKPVEGALVSANGAIKSVLTDAEGNFTISVKTSPELLRVRYKDFYNQEVKIFGRDYVKVYLIPESETSYSPELTLPFSTVKIGDKTGTTQTVYQKNLSRNRSSSEEMLQGNVASVRVISKNGLPGEGNVVNYRGIRSLTGNNAPIMLLDGMPILPNISPSPVFTGYSRNIYGVISPREIDNLSVLGGYEGASMGAISSNGMLMVTSDRPEDMETKVEFETVTGFAQVNNKLPQLDQNEFTRYFYQIGQTMTTANDLVSRFPFLLEDPKYGTSYYAYHHNTDWQDVIFRTGFVTDNMLRIKGGDEIAKYSLMAGYQQQQGIVKNTDMNRYYARYNAQMIMNKKLSMYVNMGFSYFKKDMAEQGLVPEINPLLTALRKPAILGTHAVNARGRVLSVYDNVREFGISNPLAVVNTVKGSGADYNMMMNLRMNYQINNDLMVKASAGINYNYNREKLFVPGMSSNYLSPMLDGKAKNLIRQGSGFDMNYYGNATINYHKEINGKHEIDALAGGQFMWSERLYEYGRGMNTASDFDKNLGNVQDMDSKLLGGYNDIWKWGNLFVNAGYIFDKQFYAGVKLTADATSATGDKADLFELFPSGYVAWKINQAPFLRNAYLINDLTLRAEISTRGNGLMPVMISKYHYTAIDYKEIGGIIRANIPNEKLKMERLSSYNAGLDFSTWGYKLKMNLDVYYDRTSDMILQQVLPSSYGSISQYANLGEMETKGIELGITGKVLQLQNLEWTLGATVGHYKSKIVSLGDRNQIINKLSDGAEIISRVGDSPYAFYGLKMEGVYATTKEAESAGLKDYRGMPYRAGDIRYANNNSVDKIINEKDKMIIGDATPDVYGGVYTNLKYHGFSLDAQFTYSIGNDIYNATRRQNESMKDLAGQSTNVLKNWRVEGQQTDVPRAEFGDPMNNSQFSSRWIEDGSYFKLKYLTLGYEWQKLGSNISKLQFYVTAENLFTISKYLGYDPELAFNYTQSMMGVDYAKIPGTRTYKFGVRIGF